MAINNFTFSGNAGGDMECRWTPNNKCIGTFNLPAKSGWGDNEKTSWVQCKVLGERAQKLAEHIKKGTKVTVSGEFILEQWQHEGKDYSRPTVVVNSLDLGGQPQGNNSGYQQGNNQKGGYQQQGQRTQGNNQNRNQQQNGNGQQAQGNQNQGNRPPMAEPDFDFDDDIPFIPLFKQYRGMHYAV